MTLASQQALQGMRDLSTLQWYVIPMLAYTFYIYVKEAQKGLTAGDWNGFFAGLTIFGVDFVNETWNGWVFYLTQRSAFWTVPGPTALRTMIGWNIEIMFMFAILGIIFYNTILPDPKRKILGLQSQWFWAIGYSAFCVFIECFLNIGGLLIWEYSFWNLSFGGLWLIFLIGYFHFFVAAIITINLKTIRAKITWVACIYAVAIVMNIYGFGIKGWVY
jgi:hypothetical protein